MPSNTLSAQFDGNGNLHVSGVGFVPAELTDDFIRAMQSGDEDAFDMLQPYSGEVGISQRLLDSMQSGSPSRPARVKVAPGIAEALKDLRAKGHAVAEDPDFYTIAFTFAGAGGPTSFTTNARSDFVVERIEGFEDTAGATVLNAILFVAQPLWTGNTTGIPLTGLNALSPREVNVKPRTIEAGQTITIQCTATAAVDGFITLHGYSKGNACRM